MTVENHLRRLAKRSLDMADVYKAVLGTIAELRAELAETQERLRGALAETEQLRKELEAMNIASENRLRHATRDAFLEGANWLERRLRDKPLSAYYTRMAWEEACKRWDSGRD